MFSNGYPGEAMATDPESSVVGAKYWWFVEKVKQCVDGGLAYRGIPGMDEELYSETVRQLVYAVNGFSDILYSAWIDASSLRL